MNKLYILPLLAVGIFAFSANAGIFDITFPIPELGNCADRLACKKFCDEPANLSSCQSFAEKNGLVVKHENKPQASPGNLDKISVAIKNGGPGGCKTNDACKTYCADSANSEECLSFARSYGLLKQDELQNAQKFLDKFKDKTKKFPGDCKNQQECEKYCSAAAHHEECIAFAKSEGFITKEQADKIGKFKPLMDKGETPGKCQSREECEEYCHEKEHFNECSAFAVKVGSMTPADAEQVKKTGGVGPGGCKGPDECRAFCSEEINREACVNFAQEHNLIPPQKLNQIKQEVRPPEIEACLKTALGDDYEKFKAGQLTKTSEIEMKVRPCFPQPQRPPQNGLQNKDMQKPNQGAQGGNRLYLSPEAEACVKAAIGEENFEKFRNGQLTKTSELGEKVGQCFQKNKLDPAHPTEPDTRINNGMGKPVQMQLPPNFVGPGGCKTMDECRAYCQEHPDTCKMAEPRPMPNTNQQQPMPMPTNFERPLPIFHEVQPGQTTPGPQSYLLNRFLGSIFHYGIMNRR